MLRRMGRLVITLCCLVSCPLTATAGFDEALKAAQTEDYPTAINEARQASGAGDARGSFLLGVIYQSGLGVTASTKWQL